MRRLAFIVGLFIIFTSLARAEEVIDYGDARHLVRIQLHTPEELYAFLQRSQQLLDAGRVRVGHAAAIEFVLHGPEARSLLLDQYRQNKQLIDLAAKLSAFKVVNISVCETWMEAERIESSRLPPFVSTVPYGPEAESHFLENGYTHF